MNLKSELLKTVTAFLPTEPGKRGKLEFSKKFLHFSRKRLLKSEYF